MSKKKLVELLKSGKFTILYHDHGCCSVHPGHILYEQSDKDEKVLKYVKQVAEFADSDSFCYTPEIVELLVEALGGKVDSI